MPLTEYCEYNQTVSNPQYFNHYIEIYNGTGDSVDMSKYQLWRSFNANGWNNNAGVLITPITLRGKLGNNRTYVISRQNLSATPISISADTSQTCSYLNISGDDAIALAKDDGAGNFAIIDLIGSQSADPGDAWNVAGVVNATMNHTLVRKISVCGPTTDWNHAAGTNADDSEWIVLSQNDIANLNKHVGECNGIVPEDTVPVDTVPVTPVDTNKYKFTSLFIGNSYTYYNDLPVLINKLANTTGDTLLFAQSTPGGYTLEQHSTYAASLSALKAKSYDYVVVQEQSQRPALDSATNAFKFFKYASFLDSIRKVFSPCGQTMLYMTWGRKTGDANNCSTNPNVCTYEGMDSMLNVRYRMAQKQLGALISPVGAVRNYLRKHHPEIELYESDNSHPSPAGSYVSAVTFYASMFKKDPSLTTYDFTIGADIAKIIKEAAKMVVFDSLSFWNTYQKGAAPEIAITLLSPVKTDTYEISQNFNLEATIGTSVGAITEVLFYLNGNLVGTKNAAPYQLELNSAIKGKNSVIVTVKNTDGGINSVRVDFYVKAAVVSLVLDKSNASILNIYPNPTSSNLTIKLNSTLSSAEYQISNLSGQVFQSGIIEAGTNRVRIEQLLPGVYTLLVTAGNKRITEKFIKK